MRNSQTRTSDVYLYACIAVCWGTVLYNSVERRQKQRKAAERAKK